MMSLLTPWFLIGGLTAAIPVVLHLLRQEPEPRVKFAAVRLLMRAPVAHTEKRHLRELLLLALRVAALILVALAFARPFFESAGARGSAGATIVALDTSYSMSAPGAFARARQLAKQAVDQAGSGELIAVVTFADTATVVTRPGAGRAEARAAIDAAAPGFGATRYRGALSAAVQALAGRRGTIVVVTDLQESGWDAGDRASVPESARIEWLDGGAAPPNLAVTAVRAEGDRIIASIRNSGDAARDVRARLTLDERSAGEAAATVGAHAAIEVAFAGGATAASAAVAVDDRGGLAADDVRYAVLDRASRPAVLVVTTAGDLARDAPYLQQALAAGASGGRNYQPAAATPAQLTMAEPAQLAANAAIVLLSTRGLERRGREALARYVEGGGGLLIAIGPDVDGEVVADVLGARAPLRVVTAPEAKPLDRSLVAIDARHPLLQPFAGGGATLGLVTFHHVARVEAAGCRPIARFTSGEAALLDCEAAAGRAIVFGSDLDGRWNDFPRRATFVPFVHETLRYLSGGESRGAERLIADVPAGVAPVPGVVTLPAASGSPERSRRIAVNVDPRESDPARLPPEEFQSAVTRLKELAVSERNVDARQQEDRQHLWVYLVGAAIATLAAEAVVASRTA